MLLCMKNLKANCFSSCPTPYLLRDSAHLKRLKFSSGNKWHFKKHNCNNWGSDGEYWKQATGKKNPILVPVKWKPSIVTP